MLNPQKVNRNPVACSDLTPRSAWIATFIVAVLSALTYALLGFWPFAFGLLSLLLGFLYSWRVVRLKTVPFLDMASHCLMLAGLQFLTAYFTFQPSRLERWLFPFLFIIALSLYGELFNELRDFDEDLKAGVTHTATLLGRRHAYYLMMSFFTVGVFSILYTIIILRLFPLWVLLLIVILTGGLVLRPLLRIWQNKTSFELQHAIQKPVEIAAAFTLLLYFIGQWVVSIT